MQLALLAPQGLFVGYIGYNSRGLFACVLSWVEILYNYNVGIVGVDLLGADLLGGRPGAGTIAAASPGLLR